MKRELGLCVVCFLFSIFAVRVYGYSTVTEPSLITLLPPVYNLTDANPKPDSNSGSVVLKDGLGNPVNATWRSGEKVPALVKGPKNRPPSSYAIKFESFTTLINSKNTNNYFTRRFYAGGYNWSLIVYPKYRTDVEDGYIGLYIILDSSSFTIDPNFELYANLEFFVYNKKEKTYYTMKFGESKRFIQNDRVWGLQFISLKTFQDVKNGFLYDGDNCEFGVDVFVTKHYEKWEVFKILDNFPNPKFAWGLRKFSMLDKKYYKSDDYSIGGRNWYLQVYPGGYGNGEGNSVSLYIKLGDKEILKNNEYIYAIVYIRIIDQLKTKHIEYKMEGWYEYAGTGSGQTKLISFKDLKDPSRGFLVRDTVKFEVEFLAISTTNYLP